MSLFRWLLLCALLAALLAFGTSFIANVSENPGTTVQCGAPTCPGVVSIP
jgi:hypothetical protein